MTDTPPVVVPTELVKIADLTPHPKNYRGHPDDQLAHLAAAIRQHGFYKNVVVATDYTILAGHGAVLAADLAGLAEIPVARLDIAADSPQALKIVAGDNEIGRLSDVDDRALSELLKQVMDTDVLGLLGSGYDEMMLANLAMVTRHSSEIADLNAAAEWVGMPDYEPQEGLFKVVIGFTSNEDRHRFLTEFALWPIRTKGSAEGTAVFSGLWPVPEEIRHDSGLRYYQTETGAT